MLNQNLLLAYAKDQAKQDHSGHAFDHITRVVQNAKQLLAHTPAADSQIVMAAAVMHDTYDDKLVAKVSAARSAAKQALEAAGATADQIQAIIAIIDHMGFKANLGQHQTLSLEGQLVQDADRLDAIGAIGIARTFMYGGAHAGRMYDPDLPPRTELNASTYRKGESTVINHFYEKLFLLEQQMNTAAAKALAARRTAVMHRFVDEFLAEISGEA